MAAFTLAQIRAFEAAGMTDEQIELVLGSVASAVTIASSPATPTVDKAAKKAIKAARDATFVQLSPEATEWLREKFTAVKADKSYALAQREFGFGSPWTLGKLAHTGRGYAQDVATVEAMFEASGKKRVVTQRILRKKATVKAIA